MFVSPMLLISFVVRRRTVEGTPIDNSTLEVTDEPDVPQFQKILISVGKMFYFLGLCMTIGLFVLFAELRITGQNMYSLDSSSSLNGPCVDGSVDQYCPVISP